MIISTVIIHNASRETYTSHTFEFWCDLAHMHFSRVCFRPSIQKTPSHKYRNPHYKTKTVWRPSQVYNGDSYTVFLVNRGPGLLHWCWSNLMATIRLPRYHETTRIIWVYKPRTCLLSSTLIGQSYMTRLKLVTLKHGNVNFRKAFQLEFVPWIYHSPTFPRCCCSYRM